MFRAERLWDDPRAAKACFSLVRIFKSRDKLIVNIIDGRKVYRQCSESKKGAHVHAINTRPSFLPRGAGSEANFMMVYWKYRKYTGIYIVYTGWYISPT